MRKQDTIYVKRKNLKNGIALAIPIRNEAGKLGVRNQENHINHEEEK